MSEALLAVDGLRVEFATDRGRIYAVNGISFAIAEGETIGIVGESGCGKSVTSLALLGILARSGGVTSGTAMFAGRDLLKMSDRELRAVRGKEIAMIFQDPMTSLNPVHTVGRADSRSADGALRHVDTRSQRAESSSFSSRWESRARDRARRTTRISSPAACASER